MKITKLNYELYAIDYLEGNLSKEDKALFNQFLDQQPKVKEELTDYLEAPILNEDSSIVFENKEALLRPQTKIRYWMGSLMLALVLVGAIAYNYQNTTTTNPTDNYKVNTPAQLEETITNPIALAKTTARPNPASVIPKTKTVLSKENATFSKASKEKISNSSTTAIKKSAPAIVARSKQSRAPHITKAAQHPAALTTLPVVTVTKKQQIPLKKIETAELLSALVSKAIVSQEKVTLISDKKMKVIIDLNSDYESEKKGSRWWSILTPKAYSDLDLKEVFASNSLTSTINDFNSKK